MRRQEKCSRFLSGIEKSMTVIKRVEAEMHHIEEINTLIFFFIKTKIISEPNYKADATLTI